jgi:hypothetical protein
VGLRHDEGERSQSGYGYQRLAIQELPSTGTDLTSLEQSSALSV